MTRLTNVYQALRLRRAGEQALRAAQSLSRAARHNVECERFAAEYAARKGVRI